MSRRVLLTVVVVAAALACTAAAARSPAVMAVRAPTPCQMALQNISVLAQSCGWVPDLLEANITAAEFAGIMGGVCSNAGYDYQSRGKCSQTRIADAVEEATTLCTRNELYQAMASNSSEVLTFVYWVCGRIGTTSCFAKLPAFMQYLDHDTVPKVALDAFCDDCSFKLWDDALTFPNKGMVGMASSILGTCMRERGKDDGEYCSLVFSEALAFAMSYNFTELYRIGCESPCYHRALTLYSALNPSLPTMPYVTCNRNTSTPGGALCWEIVTQALKETQLIEMCLLTTPTPVCANIFQSFIDKTGCCGRLILPIVASIMPDVYDILVGLFASKGIEEDCVSDPIADRQFVKQLTIMNLDESLIPQSQYFYAHFLLDLMIMSGLRNNSIGIVLSSRKRHETTFTVTFTCDSIPHKNLIQQQFEANLYAGRFVLPFSNLDLSVRDTLYTPLTLFVPEAPVSSSDTTPPTKESSEDPNAAATIAVGFSAIVAALVAAF